jgi:hypothetical protein
VITDGRIGDGDAQLGQFSLDSFAAPGGMTGPHLPNEGDQSAAEGGAAAVGASFPAP